MCQKDVLGPMSVLIPTVVHLRAMSTQYLSGDVIAQDEILPSQA